MTSAPTRTDTAKLHNGIANCYCVHCKNKHQSTITNYKITLNQLHNVESEGSCLECGHRMGHYLETGAHPKTANNAEAIWKTNKTLEELKIKKNDVRLLEFNKQTLS